MTSAPEPGPGRHRPLAAAGALGASAIAVLFATVGDGVDARATGLSGAILDHGHTATWVLLACALGLTAWGRGPRWLPRAFGWAGLGAYLTFLLALVTHDQA
ncbi:hypothetical protein [Cellulomonas soli]|uniref:Uncharacterized protein n=1 Tax=Cellulomonas soli TaxID=931535 RepID=A0A512PDI1_9CELL|nr:hypothetical protein [Cellulomonas soli]NYI60082.1 hypothetical protein [Cellulomonas soli]GEP69264.1 hypothetical protein CSO01_19790 [Cellulomonas soli]